MVWHYSIDGARGGPVTDEEFEELIFDGIITRSSLVWREGMEDWQPLSVLRPGPATASARTTEALPDDQAICVECNQAGQKEDMLLLEGAWVCARCKPTLLQRLREGAAISTGGAWQSGDKLVLGLKTSLPDRCVKCNAPAHGFRLKRHLNWHPGGYYLLFLLSPLIYIIAALCVRKIARIEVGLCEQHRARRRNWMIGCWTTAILSIGFTVVDVTGNGTFGLIGLPLLAAAAIAGVVTGRVVAPTRIDKEHIWLKGAGPKYLDGFPDWTGPT